MTFLINIVTKYTYWSCMLFYGVANNTISSIVSYTKNMWQFPNCLSICDFFWFLHVFPCGDWLKSACNLSQINIPPLDTSISRSSLDVPSANDLPIDVDTKILSDIDDTWTSLKCDWPRGRTISLGKVLMLNIGNICTKDVLEYQNLFLVIY